mmetsp:Transcript_5803/g.15039  ORF Transcript_5803/g.15039 Transcript_5803/m.15039 type:complete len:242 (+) Transcript_5803:434-1159(+)
MAWRKSKTIPGSPPSISTPSNAAGCPRPSRTSPPPPSTATTTPSCSLKNLIASTTSTPPCDTTPPPTTTSTPSRPGPKTPPAGGTPATSGLPEISSCTSTSTATTTTTPPPTTPTGSPDDATRRGFLSFSTSRRPALVLSFVTRRGRACLECRLERRARPSLVLHVPWTPTTRGLSRCSASMYQHHYRPYIVVRWRTRARAPSSCGAAAAPRPTTARLSDPPPPPGRRVGSIDIGIDSDKI